MPFSDVLRVLEDNGLSVTYAQLRWVVTTHKVKRPQLDGSLRFDFSEENVAEIIKHFQSKQPISA